MTLYGAYKGLSNLWFPPDIRTATTDINASLPSRLPQLETDTERAVLNGGTVVVNCSMLGKRVEETTIVERVGVVPLRWGARRLLLVNPEHAKLLEKGEELCRVWRFWRQEFDPNYDAWIVGSPNRAEQRIRKNLEEGREWFSGFNLPLEVARA